MNAKSKTQLLAVLLAMTALLAPTVTLFASPAAAAGQTSVRLGASTDQLSVGETTTIEIVTTNADGGVGAYNVSVSLDDAHATITNVSVGNAGLKRVEVADDGSSAQLTVALLDTPDEGTVQIATLEIKGATPGESNLSVEVTELTDEQGRPYEVTDTSGTSVTISDGQSSDGSGGDGDDSNDDSGAGGDGDDDDSDESEGSEQEQSAATTDTPASTEITTDTPASTDTEVETDTPESTEIETDTLISTEVETDTPINTEVETAAAASGGANSNGGTGSDATLINRIQRVLSMPVVAAIAIVIALALMFGIIVSRRN